MADILHGTVKPYHIDCSTTKVESFHIVKDSTVSGDILSATVLLVERLAMLSLKVSLRNHVAADQNCKPFDPLNNLSWWH